MSQVNNSFGSGGMTLALNEQQFALFIQFLKCGSSLPILKAASIEGNQMEDMRWVLGQDIELSKDGVLINDDQRKYVWLQELIAETTPMTIQLEEIIPTIHLPLETSILNR